MTNETGIVRVAHSDRSGTGLTEWEAMDPAALVSGTPVQRGWFADENSETGYMAGVWDCTAFVDQAGPYGVDEFMLLLEGSVVMVMPDGVEITVNAGEAFVIPKGLQCQWKQPGYVRKVFMIVDDPVADGPENPSLHRVTVPEFAASGIDGAVAQTTTWFTNSTGRMSVSVTASGGEVSNAVAASAHQVLHVLDGSLALKNGATSERFEAGETAYVSAGTELSWETSAGTRLLEASYVPA
ncbi:MAG: cupin domain-containing protein [Pseudomonadota bacterium]